MPCKLFEYPAGCLDPNACKHRPEEWKIRMFVEAGVGHVGSFGLRQINPRERR